MEQTRPRPVIRSLRSRSHILVSLAQHEKKIAHTHTCFIFEYMPIVLTTELRDEFLCPESDVRTRVHVLLVQPCITVHRTIIQ
jgi:hypothetical protein